MDTRLKRLEVIQHIQEETYCEFIERWIKS
jgi:hypothetical protein